MGEDDLVGELDIETDYGRKLVRLPAGHAVFYPTLFPHEVRHVTRGERLVYNTVTGVANVENNKGRVQGFFVPNSGDANKPAVPWSTHAKGEVLG